MQHPVHYRYSAFQARLARFLTRPKSCSNQTEGLHGKSSRQTSKATKSSHAEYARLVTAGNVYALTISCRDSLQAATSVKALLLYAIEELVKSRMAIIWL